MIENSERIAHLSAPGSDSQATAEGVRVELSQRAMLDRDFVLGISGLDDLCICSGSAEPDDASSCTLLSSFW